MDGEYMSLIYGVEILKEMFLNLLHRIFGKMELMG
jgi:hypothetical protein